MQNCAGPFGGYQPKPRASHGRIPGRLTFALAHAGQASSKTARGNPQATDTLVPRDAYLPIKRRQSQAENRVKRRIPDKGFVENLANYEANL